MRILAIFGTRPEAIKLIPVIRALRATPGCVVHSCTTGQHRELLDQVLTAFDHRPDTRLPARAGRSLDVLHATLVARLGRVMDRERPDLVVVQGDTASALAGSMAAHHRRIPIGHVEAGLRTGDLAHPWPEEGHRRMIAALARHHWAPTAAAVAALRRENVEEAAIALTGNTVIDALLWMRERITASPDMTAEVEAALASIGDRRLVLTTLHRREAIGPAIAGVARALATIASRPDIAMLMPRHPNPAVDAALAPVVADHPNITRVPPLGYPALVRVLGRCDLVMTDSGGLQEEAPTLGKPVLVLRERTERPEAIACDAARLTGLDPRAIVDHAEQLLDDPADYAAMAQVRNPFGDGHAARRIAACVAAA